MSLWVLQIAGAIILLVLVLPLWRISPRGGGMEWALGWFALYAAGLAFRVSDSLPVIEFCYVALGTTLPAFLFAGARRYSGRQLPRRYWVAVAVVAAVRGVLALIAPPIVTAIGGTAVVALGVAFATRDLWQTRKRRAPNTGERLLLIALPVLALTEGVHEWTHYFGTDMVFGFFLWLVSGSIAAGSQLASIFEQYRSELEARLVARSEELRASLVRLDEQKRLVAVGTLAAGIAHQINNPIGAIAVAAEHALHVRDDADGSELRDVALARVVEEARRCGAIVKSVLQFARERPAAKSLENLNPTVDRASAHASAYVMERGGRLDLALSQDPLPVRMNPIDVEQVVINLIRNGSESRKDGANVEVRTARVDGDACILVSDDGEGIDALTQARVLEPFFTTRLSEGGTGLGLSVAHGVVTDHGGRLEIERRSCGGTTFCVRLPLAEPLGAEGCQARDS